MPSPIDGFRLRRAGPHPRHVGTGQFHRARAWAGACLRAGAGSISSQPLRANRENAPQSLVVHLATPPPPPAPAPNQQINNSTNQQIGLSSAVPYVTNAAARLDTPTPLRAWRIGWRSAVGAVAERDAADRDRPRRSARPRRCGRTSARSRCGRSRGRCGRDRRRRSRPSARLARLPKSGSVRSPLRIRRAPRDRLRLPDRRAVGARPSASSA